MLIDTYSIISYMTKQSLPAVSTVSKDTLEDFKTADKVVVVGYFDSKDTKSNETFGDVAKRNRDTYLFGATADADLAKAEGVKQPALVLYKQFDEGKNEFEQKFDVKAIEDWVSQAATPLVGEVGPETYSGYMSVSFAFIFISSENEFPFQCMSNADGS